MVISAASREKIALEIAKYPKPRGALLPALHLVQREFGWVPVEAQEWLAKKLEVPPAHVHGCVSFYTLYRQRPVGRHHIQICRTISCQLRGAGAIIEHLENRLGIKDGGVTSDGRYSLVEVECLGSCGTAPMFQVNDDYHENLTIETVDRLLESMR